MALFLNKLGNLKSYNGSKGEAGIHINNFKKTITAEYTVNAEFENASAQIKVGIIKRENEWKIYNFYVYSDAMVR